MQSDTAILGSIAATGTVTTAWSELLLIIFAMFEANITVFADCPHAGFLIDTIKATLENDFQSAAPFTIQRLAELLMSPTQHYNDLAKYLRAIERVVNVTTTTSDYPLPLLVAETNREDAEDDSLGGARLVPIPFGPQNGNGLHAEGELQKEDKVNGIVPPPEDTRMNRHTAGKETSDSRELDTQPSRTLVSHSNSPKREESTQNEDGEAPMEISTD
ncbi:Serine/threonine-protein phosphatase 4 regulatory subunit 2 [Neolecta irregularis DAH-3]|uniref:Serine/threonine-protein phosphatase 4 regulatory subunit 2 n=1 Tax=Neolecta irregularis (strain DAH-3) TaxID=1198029 RepID=A0A1U7LX47_NEOID|nr:Serine/threonine-protein phosphatase 4 regulatory subunit 2 [Neolecta irregularis DAH-3]|eukprot:OLL27132.1 Serine/threonine-protein phosphatase 4 regulatory subunit 2 [Neolecta irregularis DAH-3]